MQNWKQRKTIVLKYTTTIIPIHLFTYSEHAIHEEISNVFFHINASFFTQKPLTINSFLIDT